MVNFSCSEAYGFSFMNTPKKQSIDSLIHMLLGFYVCDFLDNFEQKENKNVQDYIDEYFLNSQNIFEKKNIFIPIIERLTDLKLLKIKRVKAFNGFSLVESEGQCKESCPFESVNKFILHSIKKCKSLENKESLKSKIKIFNKRLFSFFKSYEIKNSKYELRFFWPSSLFPELYEGMGSLFNKKYYTYYFNEDIYFLGERNLDIKLRNHKLQIKEQLQGPSPLSHFATKRKLIESELGGHQFKQVGVNKKRYIRKIGAHSQIELSLITIQGQEWKTLCIESNKIENVLALSFLINQRNSETLTYPEFLNKNEMSFSSCGDVQA